MRLTDEAIKEAKQPVRPRDFWLTVGAVLVLLCLICTYTVPRKYTHPTEICFWSGSLVMVWGALAWDLFRSSRWAFSWSRLVIAIGVTMLAGKYLWPHAPAAVAWADHAGMILLLVGIFAPYFTSAPRPKGGSDAG